MQIFTRPKISSNDLDKAINEAKIESKNIPIINVMQAKLYDFNVIDRTIESEEPYSDNKQFTIQAFAKRENGETILLHIDDFHPFFYVKIPKLTASTNHILPHS